MEKIQLKDGVFLIREDTEVCFIWNTPALVYHFSNDSDMCFVRSQRAGGDYLIKSLQGNLLKLPDILASYKKTVESKIEFKDNIFKAKLTTWLIEQRKKRGWKAKNVPFLFDKDPSNCHLSIDELLKYVPQVTEDVVKEIENKKRLIIDERINNLLQYLYEKEKGENTEPFLFNEHPNEKLLTYLAYLECASNQDFTRILLYLHEENLCLIMNGDHTINKEDINSFFMLNIKDNPGIAEIKIKLNVNGIKRLEALSKNAESHQCFVAMWFDESMKKIYKNAIKPAIEEMGYHPLRIDEKPHNNKIDD